MTKFPLVWDLDYMVYQLVYQAPSQLVSHARCKLTLMSTLIYHEYEEEWKRSMSMWKVWYLHMPLPRVLRVDHVARASLI